MAEDTVYIAMLISWAENDTWEHIHVAYLMDEQNVRIWQENLFGVL
jgi:hypothetical protein